MTIIKSLKEHQKDVHKAVLAEVERREKSLITEGYNPEDDTPAPRLKEIREAQREARGK